MSLLRISRICLICLSWWQLLTAAILFLYYPIWLIVRLFTFSRNFKCFWNPTVYDSTPPPRQAFLFPSGCETMPLRNCDVSKPPNDHLRYQMIWWSTRGMRFDREKSKELGENPLSETDCPVWRHTGGAPLADSGLDGHERSAWSPSFFSPGTH
jgi:hypothetical protein